MDAPGGVELVHARHDMNSQQRPAGPTGIRAGLVGRPRAKSIGYTSGPTARIRQGHGALVLASGEKVCTRPTGHCCFRRTALDVPSPHLFVERMPSRTLRLAANSSPAAAQRAAKGGGLEFAAGRRNHRKRRHGDGRSDTVRQVKYRRLQLQARTASCSHRWSWCEGQNFVHRQPPILRPSKTFDITRI